MSDTKRALKVAALVADGQEAGGRRGARLAGFKGLVVVDLDREDVGVARSLHRSIHSWAHGWP